MMNSVNGVAGGLPSQGQGAPTPGSPIGQSAQQEAADAMAFQLWVAQQASSLAKLKVFHSMAKQVNDQQ
ncbi:hypothetical protein HSX11_09355 [Oxalobacteraceae bacterium]|nr:hypothetical protein [Oxalobacteraceae bacterium]